MRKVAGDVSPVKGQDPTASGIAQAAELLTAAEPNVHQPGRLILFRITSEGPWRAGDERRRRNKKAVPDFRDGL